MIKKLIILGTMLILICSSIPHIKADSDPIVHLPPSTAVIYMCANVAQKSYFNLRLTNVPLGYDINDGNFSGWCIQRDARMDLNVNNSVQLNSSYDPYLPGEFANPNWPKINYVINHDEGYNRSSIQNVIWYYMEQLQYPMNDTSAIAMINDADASGSDFVPIAGQQVAVICDVISQVHLNQRTFLELTVPSSVPPSGSVGGFIWRDDNHNGIQDSNEPGLSDITVTLFSPGGSTTEHTNSQGRYSFDFVAEGEYYIKVALLDGYRFSPENQGSDATDSDVNITGCTPSSTFDPDNSSNVSWDAGMYHVDSQGNPSSPPEPGNHKPTADGTAGEPYRGVVGEILIFNGSRSYDLDGTIVTWNWTFGDGATANGAVVSHVYTASGNYTVTLIVVDNEGANDTYHTKARIQTNSQAPLKPSFTGPSKGDQNISYEFDVSTTDPHNSSVRYVIDWGDGLQNTSLFVASGQHVLLTHLWSHFGFYMIRVHAINAENFTSDELALQMAVGVEYVGAYGYLINTDGVGPFDLFYNNQTQQAMAVHLNGNGEYVITFGGQDYAFNALTGSLVAGQKAGSNGALSLMSLIGIAIVIILVAVLAIFVVWFRRRSKGNE